MSDNYFENEIWTKNGENVSLGKIFVHHTRKETWRGLFLTFPHKKELRLKFSSTNWKGLKIEYRASSELLRSSFPNAQSQNGCKQTPIVKLQSISVIHISRFCFCKKWSISFNGDRRWYTVFPLQNWISVIPHFQTSSSLSAFKRYRTVHKSCVILKTKRWPTELLACWASQFWITRDSLWTFRHGWLVQPLGRI